MNVLLRNIEDMECLQLTVKVLNNLTSRIINPGKWTSLSKFMFSESGSKSFSLKQVKGEPVSKILISDLPTGGSTDHVDQRGVWNEKHVIIYYGTIEY